MADTHVYMMDMKLLTDAAELLRRKGLSISLSYRKLSTGKKSLGWKWTARTYLDDGKCERHRKASTPAKAIIKLLEIEGILDKKHD